MPENTEPTTENTEPQESPAQETDWKAAARKWEDRSKANHKLVETTTAERDAALAENETLKAAAADWEAKFTALQGETALDKARADIAAENGVDASLLRGETPEELQAHAEAIKTAFEALPVAPVVKTQGRAPEKLTAAPELQAVKELFGS